MKLGCIYKRRCIRLVPLSRKTAVNRVAGGLGGPLISLIEVFGSSRKKKKKKHVFLMTRVCSLIIQVIFLRKLDCVGAASPQVEPVMVAPPAGAVARFRCIPQDDD